MPFDPQSGGHRFDFSRGVCVRCDMPREHYEDNGKPRCVGKPAASLGPANEDRHFVPED